MRYNFTHNYLTRLIHSGQSLTINMFTRQKFVQKKWHQENAICDLGTKGQ